MAVKQLRVHYVMNTAAHNGSNTALSAQCYEHSSKVSVIQLKAHSVMSTATHNENNIAYSAQFYEHSITQWQ